MPWSGQTGPPSGGTTVGERRCSSERRARQARVRVASVARARSMAAPSGVAAEVDDLDLRVGAIRWASRSLGNVGSRSAGLPLGVEPAASTTRFGFRVGPGRRRWTGSFRGPGPETALGELPSGGEPRESGRASPSGGARPHDQTKSAAPFGGLKIPPGGLLFGRDDISRPSGRERGNPGLRSTRSGRSRARHSFGSAAVLPRESALRVRRALVLLGAPVLLWSA